MRIFTFSTCVSFIFFGGGQSLPTDATTNIVNGSHANLTHFRNFNVEKSNIANKTTDTKVALLSGTRRILEGRDVKGNKRPYMVYLQLTQDSAKIHKYRGWLCGGVVVHKSYVLTSAACIEDAEHFYVVSGTRRFVDSFDYLENQCGVTNRRKVVWKCIPKNYKFNIEDSAKWASNDIAIIKVERPFRFGQVEKNCAFAVYPIMYNNISMASEKPRTNAFIAGWGSKGSFREGVYRRASDNTPVKNSECLQEASVQIMDTKECAKRWAPKYRSMIQEHMICTQDVTEGMSALCNKKYANCSAVTFPEKQSNPDGSDDESDKDYDFRSWLVDTGRHLQNPDDASGRRRSKGTLGGFCENDHGGPLIVKYQRKELVIGIIAACKINPKTHICHGPFLYTSVYKHRQFISCSIYKNVESSCRRVFRSGITHEEIDISWRNHPDGPADNEKDHTSDLPTDKDGNSSEDSQPHYSEDNRSNNDKSQSESGKDSNENDDSYDTKSHKDDDKKHKRLGDVDKPKTKARIVRDGDESYVSSKEEGINDPDKE